MIDSKGLWSAHIEQTVKEACQKLGAISIESNSTSRMMRSTQHTKLSCIQS